MGTGVLLARRGKVALVKMATTEQAVKTIHVVTFAESYGTRVKDVT